jgi:hypothetical protein
VPVITVQPQNRLVDAGGIAVFRVQASSPVPFAFQWRRDGVPLSSNSKTFGATGSQLVLLDVQGRDIGIYSVEVRNSAGSVVSAEAALRVNTTFRLQVGSEHPLGDVPFSFEVGGRVGSCCAVEISSNLVDWIPTVTFTNTEGLVWITDPGLVVYPLRFYRAVVLSP